MTSLSQYLRAERVDSSEPVSFYIPGGKEWGDLSNQFKFANRANVPVDDELLYPSARESREGQEEQ